MKKEIRGRFQRQNLEREVLEAKEKQSVGGGGWQIKGAQCRWLGPVAGRGAGKWGH